jgi:hypothetical protein
MLRWMGRHALELLAGVLGRELRGALHDWHADAAWPLR